jgi:hypothetical protein
MVAGVAQVDFLNWVPSWPANITPSMIANRPTALWIAQLALPRPRSGDTQESEGGPPRLAGQRISSGASLDFECRPTPQTRGAKSF